MGGDFLLAGGDLSWSAWTFEPTVLFGVALAGGLYTGGVFATRQRGDGERLVWWRPLSFVAGLAAVLVALTSPIDRGADTYLLLLHMVQHALLATIAPPLLILGIGPQQARRLSELPGIGRLLLLAHPLVAILLFVVNMWFWHAPPVYGAALDNLWLHVVMHLAFFVSGLLFWWPLLQEWPAAIRMSLPARLLYLVVSGFPMGLLAVFLFASPDVLYAHYETAPRLWGISPMADQQVAGLVMGGLGETASFVAFTYFFARLMAESDSP
ncbi:MAG: hypothetical protein GEU28_03945 [Dehalococcoidia bacterium]|nr:hypothetical protein [Dehalococcoidia bacterium]